MNAVIEQFRKNILDSGYVLDPEGVHHEFVSGKHGRKLDFDLIPKDSPLFEQWVEAASSRIEELYGEEDLGTIVILSVANGTNRLVRPVSDRLGDNYVSALTEKATSKSVKLTRSARFVLQKVNPQLVVALEDVGTSGTTSASAVLAVREMSIPRVEALNTWQRRSHLEVLETINAPYNSIIHEDLPTYTPDECERMGYHALGWKYVPRPVEE